MTLQMARHGDITCRASDTEFISFKEFKARALLFFLKVAK